MTSALFYLVDSRLIGFRTYLSMLDFLVTSYDKEPKPKKYVLLYLFVFSSSVAMVQWKRRSPSQRKVSHLGQIIYRS